MRYTSVRMYIESASALLQSASLLRLDTDVFPTLEQPRLPRNPQIGSFPDPQATQNDQKWPIQVVLHGSSLQTCVKFLLLLLEQR